MTAYHKVLDAERDSRLQHKYAVGSGGLGDATDSHPCCKTNSAQENAEKFQTILTARRKTQDPLVRTFLWHLLKPAKSSIGIMRDLHVTDTKQMVLWNETVRPVKEGASSELVESGLQESWWAEALECHCYLRSACKTY